MKAGTQAAIAVGIGYLLGRRRKLRRAAILAAVTASGRFGGLSRALVDRGLHALETTELAGKLTPQLGEIADTARSELLDAGKTAAMALVSNRVESLSDALHSRAEVLRGPATVGTGIADAVRGGRSRPDEPEDDRGDYRSRRKRQDEDEYETDEYETDEDEYEDEGREDYRPEEEDEYEPDDQEEMDGKPGPAPRHQRSRVQSSPVSRAGR